MSVNDEQRIRGVVQRLAEQTDGEVPSTVIEGHVRKGFETWSGAMVRDFVPIFVERRVSDELGLRRSAREHARRRDHDEFRSDHQPYSA